MYDGVYTWYLPTFNVDFSRYSPGEVMLKNLLESALASRVREFDFTVGDSPHKERFANLKRQNKRIEIASRERPARAAMTVDTTQRTVVEKGFWTRLFGPQRDDTQRETSAVDPEAHVGPHRPRLGVRRRRLWRTAAFKPAASEFRVRWARYSHVKALARQEGAHSRALILALARMRRGQRAVAVFWQGRTVAVLWLARDPRNGLERRGFEIAIVPGGALLVDAQLSSDLQTSPRREALMPAIQTFLAAEGISTLYGVSDADEGPSFPECCGVDVRPVAERTDVGMLFRTWSFQRKQDGSEESRTRN